MKKLISTLSKKPQWQDQVLDHMSEGLLVIDQNQKLTYINSRAKQLLEISSPNPTGKSLKDLSEENPLIKHCLELLNRSQKLIEFSKGDNQRIELRYVHKKNNKKQFFFLQDSSCEMKMRDMGKDFVANASHELRTPITIVRGFAETLRDLPKISEVMLEDIIEKIIRNCLRMSVLVKNLLTLADLEAIPKSRFQGCDLVALLDNCNSTLLSLHPEIRIETLHNKETIMVRADPDLLELALMNILENGVKYSKTPANLHVTIEEKKDKIRLSIKDHGIGIPPKDVEKIFDRFYTVNKAHSRRLGGAGLGLAIVKSILTKHEGKIDVTSEVGEGTTFNLLFPKPNA